MSKSVNSENFTIGPVTLAYQSLFEPSAPRGSTQDPKYNTTFVVSKDVYNGVVLPQIQALIDAKFTSGEDKNPSFKWPFTPCEAKQKTYPPEKTAGMFYGNGKTLFPVEVLDNTQGRTPLMEPALIKDGTQAYLSINLFTFDGMSSGIGIGLQSVLYIGPGEALNNPGKSSAKEAFAGVQVDPAMAPPQAATGQVAPPASTAPVATGTPPPPPK